MPVVMGDRARALIVAEGRAVQQVKNEGQYVLEMAMKESDHGAKLYAWACDLERLNPGVLPGLARLHHIPNGGKRDKLTARKLELEGVLPGVSDYFLPVPVGGFCGLYLELKIIGNKATPDQRRWLEESTEFGYRAALAYGWRSAALLILKYYADGLPNADTMSGNMADQAIRQLDPMAAGL